MSLNSELSKLPAWVQWLITLVISAVLFVFIKSLFDKGAEFERKTWQFKEAQQTIANQAALAKKDTQLRVLERRLQTQATEITIFYKGEYEKKLAEKDRILSAVRAGSQRLSIPVTSTAAACAGGISLSSIDRPGFAETPRAELSATAAQFLVDIGAECDAEVIHANEVKDHLAACRAALEQQQLILKKE